MSRQELKTLVDSVPEECLQSLQDYILFLLSQQDDFLTHDEIQAFNASKEEVKKGEYFTHEEVWG